MQDEHSTSIKVIQLSWVDIFLPLGVDVELSGEQVERITMYRRCMRGELPQLFRNFLASATDESGTISACSASEAIRRMPVPELDQSFIDLLDMSNVSASNGSTNERIRYDDSGASTLDHIHLAITASRRFPTRASHLALLFAHTLSHPK